MLLPRTSQIALQKKKKILGGFMKPGAFFLKD